MSAVHISYRVLKLEDGPGEVRIALGCWLDRTMASKAIQRDQEYIAVVGERSRKVLGVRVIWEIDEHEIREEI